MDLSVLTKAFVILLVVLIIYLNDTAALKMDSFNQFILKTYIFFSTYSLDAQTCGLLAPLKNDGLHP